MEEVERDRILLAGFVLTLQVLRSMDVQCDQVAILRRLQEAAAGEVSLYNSAEDEVAASEREFGTTFDADHREAALDHLSTHRAEMDAVNRFHAARLLVTIEREQRAA